MSGPSYVDAYIAIDTLRRLLEDGATMRLSFDTRERQFHVELSGWPFDKPLTLGQAAEAFDLEKLRDAPPPEPPAAAWSPVLVELLESCLELYREARAQPPPPEPPAEPPVEYATESGKVRK